MEQMWGVILPGHYWTTLSGHLAIQSVLVWFMWTIRMGLLGTWSLLLIGSCDSWNVERTRMGKKSSGIDSSLWFNKLLLPAFYACLMPWEFICRLDTLYHHVTIFCCCYYCSNLVCHLHPYTIAGTIHRILGYGTKVINHSPRYRKLSLTNCAYLDFLSFINLRSLSLITFSMWRQKNLFKLWKTLRKVL